MSNYATSQNSVAMVGVLGGFFQFMVGLFNELDGFFRVATQLVLICFLRFDDFSVRLNDVMLRLRQVWVTGGTNIGFRRLGERNAHQH